MILCFDIGGSLIKAATAHSADAIVPLGSRATPIRDAEAFLSVIEGFVAESGLPSGDPVAVSIAGVVDPASGLLRIANIPCLDGKPLQRLLEARLNRPALVANDADCFALAEATVGAGRGKRVVFGAILGTGIGGGLIVDGRIHRGAGGFAGEWGHGPVSATEVGEPPRRVPRILCGCGLTGCLDATASARGMERLHRHFTGTDRSSREIVSDWQAGDAAAAATIDALVEILAGPLAMLVNVIGPDIIPVGGGLSNAPALIAKIDIAVRPLTLSNRREPLVVPALCTVEPGLIGAAILGGAA